MTKQQNRSSGFGTRMLSVLLAVLMVLTTFAVVLTATSLSAGAAISYWQVAGNFNDWGNSLSNTAYRINSGSGGSVTIPMTESSIQFKMVAEENGGKWCGNSSGSATVGTETELSWNSGENITVALPANTVSVTFTLAVKNGKNYVTVTANTEGGGGGGDTSEMYYNAPVNQSNSANTDKDKIFWATATYFDYMSDEEISNTQWLKPVQAGTNFNGSIDEWYPFYLFNRDVVKKTADLDSSWSLPLYFGNFCNVTAAYDTSHHPGVTNGFIDATGSYNVTRFKYAPNNSNKDNVDSANTGVGLSRQDESYQGLMNSKLDAEGNLLLPDGSLAPYFNADALNGYAKVITSAFPFRVDQQADYTRYEFDSTNAKDNVYFTWDTNGSTTYPTAVNYGAGIDYGVQDGISRFMKDQSSGYGIFPFNNKSNNYKGTKTNANENLNYGFGIRIDVNFRIPKTGSVTIPSNEIWVDSSYGTVAVHAWGNSGGTSSPVALTKNSYGYYVIPSQYATQPNFLLTSQAGAYTNQTSDLTTSGYRGTVIKYSGTSVTATGQKTISKIGTFEFSGDDDLWMYITNNRTKESQLVLDMGGSHSKSTGSVDFTTKEAIVDYAYNGQKNVKKSFAFNPDDTYTMSVFYMERGLIESNMKMGFTLTPLGNNFIVTEEIDTTNVNSGIADVVKQLSQFGFETYESNSQITDGFYKNFTLGDGGRADIPDSVLPINSLVKMNQYAPENSYLVYDASWNYYDNVSNAFHTSGTGTTSGDDTTATDNHKIINASGDEYDFAELRVDYVNTPQVTDVKITKTVKDYATLPANMKNDEFPATILLQFTSDMEPTAYDGLETSEGTIDFKSGGKVMLSHDKTITISGVPVGTRVSVVEDLSGLDEQNHKYTQSGGTGIAGNGDITITNEPATVQPIYADVSGTKLLDGDFYSGDLFGFVLNGLAPFPGDNDTVVNTLSQKELSTYTVQNGSFKIGDKSTKDATKALKFSKPGTYRYVVKEDISALEETDDLIGTTYSSDIVQSSGTPKRYLVEFNVVLQGDNTLKADGPRFFDYETDDSAYEMIFFNEVQKGSVSVEKKDQSGNTLKDVTFAVYAVPDTFETTDTFAAYGNKTFRELSADEQYAAVKASGSPAKTAVTNGEGMANLTDLSIYKSDFYPKTDIRLDDLADEPYQRYVLLESEGPSGYAINKTLNFFTIPTNGSYAFTFSGADAYVNGTIKNPTAGGIKGVVFAGIGIVLLASVLLMAYVLYMKKRGYAPVLFKK